MDRTVRGLRVFCGRAAASLAAFAFLSCGGSGGDATGPVNAPPPTDATIELSESAVTVEMGFSHVISATVKSSNGTVLSGITVTWSTDKPSVAQAIGGSIIPVSPGTAQITASASGKSATAAVTVIPTIVASIGLSRTKVTLAPGATSLLTATALDAIDRPISGRTVTLTSLDNNVVSVSSPGGVLTAKSEGRTQITAVLDNKSATASVLVVAPTQISITSSPARPAGLPPLHDYSITLRDDSDSLTATSAAGNVTLSGLMPLADSVEFVAQGDSSSGTNWPSRLSSLSTGMPASVNVVFVPKIFPIDSGTFKGTSVGISIDNAVLPCSQPGGACTNGFYSPQFRTGVTAWEKLPIPVQLIGFNSADSASIWAALRDMEKAIARSLFVPDDGTSPQNITVNIGLPPQGTGGLGYTFWNWDAAHRMTSASVSFKFSNPAANLVQHEFLHALGFGHTCSWSTVMGGYGCPMAAGLSAEDVAYVKLAYSVFQTEKTFRRPDGGWRCGTMSLWNATAARRSSVSCAGDNTFASMFAGTRILSQPSEIREAGAP